MASASFTCVCLMLALCLSPAVGLTRRRVAVPPALAPSAPPPPVSACPQKCSVHSISVVGLPTFVPNGTVPNEGYCLLHCAVDNDQFYTWNNKTKICRCFKYNSQGCQRDYRPLTGTLGLNFTGNIPRCAPFCSVAIISQAQCKLPGAVFVDNYSRARCCCFPPAKPILKIVKGKKKLAGCIPLKLGSSYVL